MSEIEAYPPPEYKQTHQKLCIAALKRIRDSDSEGRIDRSFAGSALHFIARRGYVTERQVREIGLIYGAKLCKRIYLRGSANG